MKKLLGSFYILISLLYGICHAESQRPGTQKDGTEAERDLLVIGAMLPGIYNNANQSYFDHRLKHERKHNSFEAIIERSESLNTDKSEFIVKLTSGSGDDKKMSKHVWSFEEHPAGLSLLMTSQELDTNGKLKKSSKNNCQLEWYREAGQFSADVYGDCDNALLKTAALSEKQLWIGFSEQTEGNIKMHKAREFECYADIPGVGGGRDEPYIHYQGFKIHDLGGNFWFNSEDGRRLGVSLFTVDWPMNNDVDTFTRDSLVVYVKEDLGDEVKEISYAFTQANAERIGINLKWMLVSCFMESNKDTTPFM